jgi:hypothetical protein
MFKKHYLGQASFSKLLQSKEKTACGQKTRVNIEQAIIYTKALSQTSQKHQTATFCLVCLSDG